MAINFLYSTNTRPEIQINDTDDNPRLAFLESDVVSGGISTTGGNLVFETSSGTERARILSGGNFGIGTDNPSRNLQVKGTANTAIAITSSTSNLAQLALGDTDDDNYAQILLDNSTNKLQIQNGGGGVISNRGITLDSSENVGIGTASPDNKLMVQGASTNGAASAGNVALFEGPSGTNGLKVFVDDTENAAGFQTISADDLLINPHGGNVGIGTASPIANLQVDGDVQIGDSTNPNSFGFLQVNQESNSDESGIGVLSSGKGRSMRIWVDETNSYINSGNGGSGVLILNQGAGNVGLGTTNPGAKLVVTDNNNGQDTTFRVNHTRSNSDVATQAIEVSMTLSGADTTTADRVNSGILANVVSTADGDGTNEHRLYGVYSNVAYSGMSDLVRGGYFKAESNNNTEKTAQTIGVYGQAVHDAGSANGGVSTLAGVYGQASLQDTGDVNNTYGGFFLADISNTRIADVKIVKGVEGHIDINKETTINYGNMSAVAAVIDNNEGSVPNFSGQYLFKGDYQGTKGTDNYGIYTDGDKNYFEGSIGIGIANPVQPLHVVGNAKVTGAYYDSNNSPGTLNQVLRSTETGTDWVDGSGSSIIGGPYLPLTGGTLSGPGNLTIQGTLTGTTASLSSSSHPLSINRTGSSTALIEFSLNSTVEGYLGATSAKSLVVYNQAATEMFSIGNTGNATLAGDVTINGSYLKLLNHTGTYEGQATDYLYIGGSGLDGSDAAIYFGNAGDNTGYGWRFYYEGTGSGNDNKLIIKSENAGSGVDALSFTQDGNATFPARITASGGINGLTLANGGISGTNYNVSGVNQLSIADPGEGIVFNGTATIYLDVIDDTADDKLRIRNATQLDLNSTARITNLVDPSLDQDAATKKYVDDSITGGANYLGVWDPDDSLNNGYGDPSLQASGRTDDSGDYFICSADGAAHPNGGTSEPDSWHVGDWVIWNEDLGTSGLWQKLDNTTVLSGGGSTNSVAKFTDNETIGDGPITFSTNDSTFAGNVTATNILTVAGAATGNPYLQFTQGGSQKAYIQYVDSGDSFELQTDNQFVVRTGGSTIACIINSSQNATFAGMITVNGEGIDIDNNDDIRLRFDNASVFKAGLQVATTVGDMIAGSAVNDFAIRAQENMLFATGGNTEKMRIASDGTVVIGSSAVGGNKRLLMLSADNAVNYDIDFQQNGTTNHGRIRYTEGAADLEFYPITGVAPNLVLKFNGNSYFQRGNVGIGTTSPDHLLDLYKSTATTSSTTGTTLQRLWNYVGSDLNQQKTFIDFVFQDDNTNEYPQVRIGAEVGQNGNSDTQIKEGSGAFVVYTNNATGDGPGTPTGLAERLRVDYKGDVGIGSNSPKSKLQVAGGIQMADDADAASANKVGTLKYYTSGNNSYVDMCMQTGASSYAWINIVQNNW